MANLLAIVVGFGLIAAMSFVVSVWQGYVLSVVWGWLVVPIFHLEPITILGAITLTLIVGFLTKQHIHCAKDPDSNQLANAMGEAFIYPLIVLIFAWVAKGFI
jgi:hypothetical protein